MCIICIKRPGLPMPGKTTLYSLWTRNPDGAGFMYACRGEVHIRKGFMNFGDLLPALAAIPDPEGQPVILHFRITTHGGTCPENTHPFPILPDPDDLARTEADTKAVCVAHNGVLPIRPSRPDLSDTMEFVTRRLAPIRETDPNFLRDEAVMRRIAKMSAGSRLAFLDREGTIRTTGDWHEDPRTGLLYSNARFPGFAA